MTSGDCNSARRIFLGETAAIAYKYTSACWAVYKAALGSSNSHAYVFHRFNVCYSIAFYIFVDLYNHQSLGSILVKSLSQKELYSPCSLVKGSHYLFFACLFVCYCLDLPSGSFHLAQYFRTHPCCTWVKALAWWMEMMLISWLLFVVCIMWSLPVFISEGETYFVEIPQRNCFLE